MNTGCKATGGSGWPLTSIYIRPAAMLLLPYMPTWSAEEQLCLIPNVKANLQTFALECTTAVTARIPHYTALHFIGR